MVDFNNETTIGRPAVDVERILILQRRDAVIDAFEAYTQIDANGAGASTHIIRARIESLRLQLYGMLRRRATKTLEVLSKRINTDDFETLLSIFEEISMVLDGIRLTRIDTKEDYDTTSIEADNKHEGL